MTSSKTTIVTDAAVTSALLDMARAASSYAVPCALVPLIPGRPRRM